MKLGLTALMALALAAAAPADVIVYNFGLDGLQEVPPVATPGTGLAEVTYDTDSNLLSWEIDYQGLTAPTTAAHFHGPADFGQNAGVRVNIGAISGLLSPMIGSTNITDAFETELLDGLWYVNIHTQNFPGGEIRGQVVPEPAAGLMLALAGLAVLRRR